MPPMTHNLNEAVTVTLTVDGTDYTGVYGPGDVELPEPVAELLEAQGLATNLNAPAVVVVPNATLTVPQLRAKALELGIDEAQLKGLKKDQLIALVDEAELAVLDGGAAGTTEFDQTLDGGGAGDLLQHAGEGFTPIQPGTPGEHGPNSSLDQNPEA